MTIENLNTYTAVGSAGVYTVNDSTVTFTAMQGDDVSYLYYDFTAGYFSNFKIEFEFEITATTWDGIEIVCGVSNIIGNSFSGDGILVLAGTQSGSAQVILLDYKSMDALSIN